MRYIQKQINSDLLTLFEQWKTENQAAIDAWVSDASKTGDHLWEELGKTFGEARQTNIDPKTLRNLLETALFNEQGGLCCYCGNIIERSKAIQNNIWDYKYRTIEHFEPKSKYKEKTFDYENLMLSCKESQKLSIYEVGKTYQGVLIKNFCDVSKITQIPISTLKSYPKNKALNHDKLSKGDKIQVPNPPHCDDEKSKYDNKNNAITIIKPTKDEQLIEQLTFLDNGTISYANRENEQNEVIENTIKVLALNCATLVERRQEKWLNCYINYNDFIFRHWLDDFAAMTENDESSISVLKDSINKLIAGKAMPDETGQLEAFYFVEVAFLKSLFNARP